MVKCMVDYRRKKDGKPAVVSAIFKPREIQYKIVFVVHYINCVPPGLHCPFLTFMV